MQAYRNESEVNPCIYPSYYFVCAKFPTSPDRDKPCPCICYVPRGPVQDFEEMLDPEGSGETAFDFYHWPEESSKWAKFLWFLSYPLELLMFLTIPNVRRQCGRSCYLIGLLMSIVWISILTYLISWMLTVVGKWIKYFFCF